jgi:hypothetical protein
MAHRARSTSSGFLGMLCGPTTRAIPQAGRFSGLTSCGSVVMDEVENCWFRYRAVGVGLEYSNIPKNVRMSCWGWGEDPRGGLRRGRFEGMKGMMKKSWMLQGVSSLLAGLPVMTCAGQICDLI